MFFFHSSLSWRASLVGLGGVLQHQRLAVGLLAPAVAVAVDVAVQVEQRLGARRVVLAHLALEGRVVAAGAAARSGDCAGIAWPRRTRRISRSTSTASAMARRSATLSRRVAADHRVLHVEVGQRDVGARRSACMPMPRLARLGASWSLGMAMLANSAGHALDQVVLAVQEGQPARLRFLDDRRSRTRSIIGRRRPLNCAAMACAAASSAGGCSS